MFAILCADLNDLHDAIKGTYPFLAIQDNCCLLSSAYTVKPVLSGHLKLDKTKVLMENGSLMEVKSIEECSPWSIHILQYF